MCESWTILVIECPFNYKHQYACARVATICVTACAQSATITLDAHLPRTRPRYLHTAHTLAAQPKSPLPVHGGLQRWPLETRLWRQSTALGLPQLQQHEHLIDDLLHQSTTLSTTTNA